MFHPNIAILLLLLAILSPLSDANCNAVSGFHLDKLTGQTNSFQFGTTQPPDPTPLTVDFSVCGTVTNQCGLSQNPPVTKCATEKCCGACQHWETDTGTDGACLGTVVTSAVAGADGKSVEITYDEGDAVQKDGSINGRKVIVHVSCGGSSHLQGLSFIQPEGPAPPSGEPYIYRVIAESNVLCGSSISIGSWFLIAFVAIAVVYLIVGVIFNKVKNDKNGVELIPNHDFWVEAPFYAVDGVKFLVGKIKEKISGGGYSYDLPYGA